MTVDEWTIKIGTFIGEIDADEDLSNSQYVEVMTELEDQAASSREAKEETIEDEEDDED